MTWDWTVRAVGGDVPAHLAGVRVPATVPGCVHLDLLAAGLIPDPYLDENERLIAWIGRVDWRYETTLPWADSDSDSDSSSSSSSRSRSGSGSGPGSYTPGSPYSFDPYSFDPRRHPNEPAHGTSHIWDVWNTVDYTEYRRYAPRFVAEFGFQGPPTWATLTRAVHDEPMRPDSPGVLLHQKAADGNGKVARGLADHLPVPTTFADWHWATSLNQARAVALGVEHFRSLTPLCMGAVVWQLNDVWPVISWSAVDGDGRCKPVWYALRRSFRDRLLTVQPREDGLALVAVNDSGRPWRVDVPVSRHDFDGGVLAAVTVRVDVTARGAVTWPLPPSVATPGDPRRELIVAGTGADRALWHFLEDVAAPLPEPRLSARVEPIAPEDADRGRFRQASSAGYRLTVTAETFVRDLTVLADRVAGDAHVDEALVTLLPGETATFDIRTAATVTPEAFLDPLVLRSANQLAARPDCADIPDAGGGK